MTVAADSYSEVVLTSTATQVTAAIPWEYGNTKTSLAILQQDLTTGETRAFSEGGFTFVKSADGKELLIEQYTPFAGNSTIYTISRNTPIAQNYDGVLNTAINSVALAAQFDNQVRMIQDISVNADSNAIISVNPFPIADLVTRAGFILAFDANGDPEYIDASSEEAAAASAASAATSATEAAASAALLVLNNFSAVIAPTITDDSSGGYAVGSRWVDTVTDLHYVLLDSTVGAAIWERSNNIFGNFAATIDPTISNDNTQGYEIGSQWINVTTDATFTCVDITTGAAVWVQTNGGGGGSLVLLETANIGPAGAATIEFTTGIDSTYGEYRVTWYNTKSANILRGMFMEVSYDAGATWETALYEWTYTLNDTGVLTAVDDLAASRIQIQVNQGNAAGQNSAGTMILYNPSDAFADRNYLFSWKSVACAFSTQAVFVEGSGFHDPISARAITGIKFYMDAGNMLEGGVLKLYGVL